MRVRYQESGGFAGLTKSREVTLDQLGAEEQDAVQAAARSAPHDLSAWSPPGRGADVPDVQLFLIHDDGRWQPLLPEKGEVPAVLRGLLDRLAREARYERGG